MPGPYAALRVARLDDWGQVGHQERHGKREGDPAEYEHCDPARRHLIQYGTDLDGMDPREVRACMKRQIDLAGARTRKGAAVGAHILAIASPEFFRPGDPAAVGAEDPEKVAAFRDATLEAIRKRYGPIAAWRVDLDETTPVVDVFLVPMSRRKTKTGKEKIEVSYRDAFGGDKHQLERLQTWFAGEVGHLGLKRGNPKSQTGRSHEPAHKRNRDLLRDQHLAIKARADAEAALQEAQQQLSIAEKAKFQAEQHAVRLDLERQAAERVKSEAQAEIVRHQAALKLLDQARSAAEADRKAAGDLRAAALKDRSEAVAIRETAEKQAAAVHARATVDARKLREAAEADAQAAAEAKSQATKLAQQAARELIVAREVLALARSQAVTHAMTVLSPVFQTMKAIEKDGPRIAQSISQMSPSLRSAAASMFDQIEQWTTGRVGAALAKIGVTVQIEPKNAAASVKAALNKVLKEQQAAVFGTKRRLEPRFRPWGAGIEIRQDPLTLVGLGHQDQRSNQAPASIHRRIPSVKSNPGQGRI